jgi:hypothetical protein
MKSDVSKIYPQHVALASLILRLMIEDGYIPTAKQAKEANP